MVSQTAFQLALDFLTSKSVVVPREVEPPLLGEVISIRQVGGLHHRYSRAA